ncbi:unnamed protein product, partial [Prorocentrum cordatum]
GGRAGQLDARVRLLEVRGRGQHHGRGHRLFAGPALHHLPGPEVRERARAQVLQAGAGVHHAVHGLGEGENEGVQGRTARRRERQGALPAAHRQATPDRGEPLPVPRAAPPRDHPQREGLGLRGLVAGRREGEVAGEGGVERLRSAQAAALASLRLPGRAAVGDLTAAQKVGARNFAGIMVAYGVACAAVGTACVSGPGFDRVGKPMFHAGLLCLAVSLLCAALALTGAPALSGDGQRRAARSCCAAREPQSAASEDPRLSMILSSSSSSSFLLLPSSSS